MAELQNDAFKAEGGGGIDWGSMDTWTDLANMGAQAVGAYTNWQGLGLAKDVFAHQKGLDQTNMFNQVALLKDEIGGRNQRRASAMGTQVQNTPQFQTLGA